MTLHHDTYGNDVRIGPISVFTLIIVICLAVLAVLAFTSANATLVMTQRQATATSELYLDEAAAQQFVAGVDDELSTVRTAGGTGADAVQAVQRALPALTEAARASSGGRVSVSASMDGDSVRAEFSCANGRMLTIVVTIRNDATFRIDKWKMTAVQNEEEPAGRLWTGD